MKDKKSDSMQKHLYLLVLVILFSSCISLKKSNNSTHQIATPIVELKRGACYGTCPIYNITLYSDKKVKYNARRFTEHIGEYEWSIQEKDFEQIIHLMDEEIVNGNIEHNIKAIDLPLTTLNYYHQNDTLQINCKGSCPTNLKEKIRVVEEILFTSAKWDSK
jgi:hypothetical protein